MVAFQSKMAFLLSRFRITMGPSQTIVRTSKNAAAAIEEEEIPSDSHGTPSDSRGTPSDSHGSTSHPFLQLRVRMVGAWVMVVAAMVMVV